MASDASPEEPRSAPGRSSSRRCRRGSRPISRLSHSPSAPMPPTRPADLILASKTDQGGGAFIPPSNKGFGPAAQRGLLPQVITAGVDRAPTGALALAEGLSPPTYDDSELLARAAALTAPLPPMPIANVGVAAVASNATTADGRRHSRPAAAARMGRSHGGAARPKTSRNCSAASSRPPRRLRQAPTNCGLRSNRLSRLTTAAGAVADRAWGSVPTGLNVLLGVKANVLSSALPTGAATAANQEVTAAGASATSAQAGASLPINLSTRHHHAACSCCQRRDVTAWDVIAAGTTNFTFEYGTGTNCLAGTTALTGPYGLVAQFGAAKGSGLGPVLVVPAGNALCAVNSATVQVSGSVFYRYRSRSDPWITQALLKPSPTLLPRLRSSCARSVLGVVGWFLFAGDVPSTRLELSVSISACG